MSEAQKRCMETRRLLSEGARLVDVRSAGEFQAGALEGAINLPLQAIHSAGQVFDADSPLVLYCATGMRSRQAKRFLEMTGFSRVFDLGGLQQLQPC